MRLLILTQWFDPETVPKGLGFAKALASRGFDVEVVTGFPNYPGGVIFDGYRIKPIQREIVDGIQVTRVALYPSHSQSRLGRVFNYVSFFLSASIYCLFFLKRPDVCYTYHPPLTVGCVAWLLSKLRGVPFVYDVQDLWPQSLAATGMISSQRILALVERVVRLVYREAAGIAAQSVGFKKLMQEMNVPAAKISVIYNWANETLFDETEDVDQNVFPPEKLTFLFAGNIGAAQGLEALVDAAKIVGKDSEQFQLSIIGSGHSLDSLKAKVESEQISNVVFHPRVPASEISRYLRNADVLVVHLRPDPLFEITIPSKTQAYMYSAKPILMCMNGEAASMVEQAGAGVFAQPGNPESIAESILGLCELSEADRARMGERAREYYDAHLSMDTAVDAFAEELRSAAKN